MMTERRKLKLITSNFSARSLLVEGRNQSTLKYKINIIARGVEGKIVEH